MKLFKAISNSIRNILGVIDNITEGTNELSLMYRDVCRSARQEQALESLNDLQQLAKQLGMEPEEIAKVQSAVAAA